MRELWWRGTRDLSVQKQLFPVVQWSGHGTTAFSSYSSSSSHNLLCSLAPASASLPLPWFPHRNCCCPLAMRTNCCCSSQVPWTYRGAISIVEPRLWSRADPMCLFSSLSCTPPSDSTPRSRTWHQGQSQASTLVSAHLLLALTRFAMASIVTLPQWSLTLVFYAVDLKDSTRLVTALAGWVLHLLNWWKNL